MEIQQHEHRDEDRCQDGPLGRSTAHEQVEEGRQEDEADNQWQAGETDALQEFGTVDGENQSQVTVVEPIDDSLEFKPLSELLFKLIPIIPKLFLVLLTESKKRAKNSSSGTVLIPKDSLYFSSV